MRSRIHWHVLYTTDPVAAADFYRTVAGPLPCAVEQLPPLAIARGAGPVWVPHLSAEDVEAASRKAHAAGAVVRIPPVVLPGTGTRSLFEDSTGALFGFFAPEVPITPEAPAAWRDTLVRQDAAAARSFYAKACGWAGPRVEVPDAACPDGTWLCSVAVADLISAVASAAAAGATILAEGPRAVLRDPQGALFGLHAS